MNRRPTLNEMLWPENPADADLPTQWAQDVSTQVLEWIWRAYDGLREKHLSRVELTQPTEQLERNLTLLHFGELQEIWARETAGLSSLRPGHEIPEFETRSSPSAKPPAYDLGFVHRENPRWIWPIEAKVLVTALALAEYLKDVNDKFISGIAAPFVGECGMIGYLLRGSPSEVKTNLAGQLRQTLMSHSRFSGRQHFWSQHERNHVPGLRLHHMIMELTASQAL